MNHSTSRTIQVAIFDDETDRANEWKVRIDKLGENLLEVRVPDKASIQAELDQLYDRRDAIDEGQEGSKVRVALDDVDILIVDFDLRHLGEHRGFATGEEIAYAARLFSSVKLIVVVNHPDIGLNNFDLTLQRDRNLRADVYIGHEQVANPALWRSSAGHDGFAPWAWPALLDDVSSFESCLRQVQENLDTKLLPYFGFDSQETMPSREMMAFLGVSGTGVTFRQIIQIGEPPPFVRPKDLSHLIQDDTRLSTLITAILRKWIRRWVLPPQTILADAPHLAMSMPWGLNDYTSPKTWHACSTRAYESVAVTTALFRPEVAQCVFMRTEWTGRPAFFAQSARSALEANDEPLRSFDFSKVPRLRFVEDLSRFIPMDQVVEYDLTLDGQPQVRAVSNVEIIMVAEHSFDPKSVTYIPQSMLL